MRQKFIRHSRSVISVILTVCMLVSCMAVGLVSTDAAKVQSESTGANSVTIKGSFDSWGSGISLINNVGDYWVGSTVVNGSNSVTQQFKAVIDSTWYGSPKVNGNYPADGAYEFNSGYFSWAAGHEGVSLDSGGNNFGIKPNSASSGQVVLIFVVDSNNKKVWVYQHNTTATPTIHYGTSDRDLSNGNDSRGTMTANGDGTYSFNIGSGQQFINIDYNGDNKAVNQLLIGNRTVSAGVSDNGTQNWGTHYMWKPQSSNNMVVTYNPATLEVSVASEAVALTVDSISNATASVTVGSARVDAGSSGSVTPGQQATITVTPTNPNKKISTAYYNGNAVSLVSNRDGSYSGTFTMPNAATTVTFGSLTDKSSYKVKVAANDSSYGTVSIALAGGGTYDENTLYPEDTAFTLNASGTSDHPFQSWDKGTNTTDNPATYYVNGDDADLDDPTVITITAAFKTNYYKADPKIYGDYTYVYQGISARFFDYYYDKEVKDGWLSYGENEAKNDNRQPYTILNQALKTYAETKNVLVPLYFGNMYADNNDVYDGMYGYQTPAGITGVTSGQNSLDYHFYWAASNSNGIKALYNEGNSYNYGHALTGLSGKSLNSSGNITHVSDKDSKTADNEAEMKLFDKDWLTSRSGPGYAYTGPLATIIDSPFPFVKETIKRIYFTNINIGSYNKAYTWSVATGTDTYDIQHNGSWPGTDLMYDSAKGKYYINVSTFAENLILSNNGSNQTSAIVIPSGKNCYDVTNNTWSVVEDNTEANYYSFDSNNGQDNAYFMGIRDGEASPKMYYYFNRNKVKDRGYPQGYGFFPYDGNFAGTNSAAQDYGYGMRMDIEFTLGENGKNALGQDQIFKFSGDDDLWVYVDGNLVLDLGGAHGRSKGEINFGYTDGVDGASATANNTTVTVDDPMAYQMYSAGQNAGNNTTALPSVHYTSASDKGVTRNTTASVDRTKQKHTLTIFYMERGKEQSNLKIGFSFSPVANDFVAEKSLNLNNVSSDATFKSAVETLANNDQFTFNNSWSDTVSGTFNAPANDLENTFTHSGTSTVKTTGGTTQIPDSSTKFKADDTDSFVDKFLVGHYFKLTETPDSSNKFNYDDRLIVTDMAQNDKRLTPADAENGVYKFDTVKTRPNYEVDPVLIKATHVNTLKTRSLTIKKEINGDSDSTTTFPIQVKIKLDKTAADSDEKYVAYQLPYVKSGGTSGTLDENGKVSLHQDETITIEGIPENASVRVSEPDALSNDYHQASCEVKASDNSSVNTTDITNGKQFAIGSKDINVVITNIQESKKSFTITKKLTTGTDATTAFTVNVTRNDEAYTGAYELNGTAYPTSTGTFTMHQNDTITIEGLRVGENVAVYETNIPFNYQFSKATLGTDNDTNVASGDATGYAFTVSEDTDLTIWNAPIKYKYEIWYHYSSYRNLHEEQQYKIVGEFDANTDKVVDYLVVSNDVEDWDSQTEPHTKVTAYWFMNDNARKNFINILGPYENNFKKKISWNTDMRSDSNTSGTTIRYNSSEHKYTIDVFANVAEHSGVDLKFVFPYKHGTQATYYNAIPESDGKVKYDTTQTSVTIPNLNFGTWYATNGVKFGQNATPTFVTAPMVIYNGDQPMGFKYWTVKTYETDLYPSVEYTKCYYREFNLSIYQNSIVEPHYENITAEEAANYHPNPHDVAIADGNANGAVVTFLENSRNQYNVTNTHITQSTRRDMGDRIYTDFVLSYASEGDLKFQDYADGTYTAGLAIQRVAELDSDGADGKNTNSAHYAELYGDKLTNMTYNGEAFSQDTLKAFIEGPTNVNVDNTKGLERSQFDANKLDNKNRIQYYYSYSVRKHTDLTDNGNKNYVYRAFAFMKDKSGTVTMVSQPLYFTFYDMASIANAQDGLGFDSTTSTP